VFGAVAQGWDASGNEFERQSASALQSAGTTSAALVLVACDSSVPPSPAAWLVTNLTAAASARPSRAAHAAWWTAFWNRSWITVSASGGNATYAQNITDSYAQTRFVQAVQSRGDWPIKFNSMLFQGALPPNADYRQWGAANWWQNTRLPIYPMLNAGDGDMAAASLFEYYWRMLPFAEGRTQTYFNFSGVFFTETKMIFGAYTSSDYGCSRPTGYPVWLESSDWIHLDFAGDGGTTELPLMILDHYDLTRNETALARYYPLINGSINFFQNFYTNRSSDGKYLFYPVQSLETYWCPWPFDIQTCCQNDMPTIATLTSLLQRALTLIPTSIAPPADRARWQNFLDQMPPLPIVNGTVVSAQVLSPGTHNVETPELYSVSPSRQFTVGRKHTASVDLQPAINAFYADPLAHSNTGWTQGIMNAAFLGLADEAMSMVISRATVSQAPGYRFPRFAQHYQDSDPSADHFANLMAALQLMLVQPGDDAAASIFVLPAWPCAWDVSFQLVSSNQTTITLDFANGAVQSFTVTPSSRTSAVTVLPCQA
jgi:hypothetical protein